MASILKFRWVPLKIALEGHSYLDFPKLDLANKEDAKRFLSAYGYEYDDPQAKEEIWGIYFESVSFLRNHLLDEDEKMPETFLSRSPSNDILKLLLEASQGSSEIGRWACSILRVMHIISHLNNDIRMEHFQYSREQIFGRFDAHIFNVDARRVEFGNTKIKVPLVRYVKRERKRRNSIILKLLAKPQTVVEAVYDSIGFRFVTENRFDSFRLIEAFFETGAVSPANIYPNRSVNNVLSIEAFQECIQKIEADHGDMDETKIPLVQKKLEQQEKEEKIPASKLRNPFSSPWYRAIQFTCRQLVRAPEPSYAAWLKLREELSAKASTKKIIEKIPFAIRETRSFYQPFEIQILDKESYVESLSGRSRHRDYKDRQRLMARNRVLRDLV
ncbi:MAG: TIGR04552 family protein [Proteobacteria bacterium]|nr:TIGR04552 family protein [Pseudomonadota bacterium]